MNAALNVGNLLSAGVQVFRDRQLHIEALNLEHEQHDAEKASSILHHTKGLFTDKQNYLISIFADIESYYQELNENLLSSTLDAERDMVDQRNQQFQTILIAGTIMLGATIGVLFQAPLPDTADDYIIGVYATSIAASITLLFINVGLCVKVISLVSRYMYRYSERNINYLKDARLETIAVMRNIRQGLAQENEGNNSTRSRKFSTLDEAALEDTWRKHEIKVNEFLQKRNELNENFLNFDEHGLNDNNYKRFNRFWNSHCRWNGRIAYICFYAGTICMLISVIAFMYAMFDKMFENFIAGYISIAIIGASLVSCCCIVVFMKYLDPVAQELTRVEKATTFPRLPSRSKIA